MLKHWNCLFFVTAVVRSNVLRKHLMSNLSPQNWDGAERRQTSNCRRASFRRSHRERRNDPRQASNPPQTFYGWIRSLTPNRLGVDRRNTGEQRIVINRRNSCPNAMLTKEEIADLLR